ncbi:retrotransposon protein, putative, ty1-copia subclass [Tanacetum coccineum]
MQSTVSLTPSIHYEDGNPARAYIKQALGSFKDGDGDGDTHYERSHKGVKASANSDIVYFFTSAQDGNTLQDDERLDLADDLMKAQVHNQRQKKWRVKLRRVRAMSMTIQSSVKDKILATSSETSKVENAPAEMLLDLDQQMEKREDDGKANVVTNALSKKERVKPRRVRAMAMTIQYGVRGMILTAQSEVFKQENVPLVGSEMDEAHASSYHSIIWCAPFEALYGKKCKSPILWAEIEESSLIGPELVQETIDKVVLIKEKLKAVRDHQKSYADNNRKPLEFEMASLHVSLDEIKVDKTLRFVEEPVEDRSRQNLGQVLFAVLIDDGNEAFVKFPVPIMRTYVVDIGICGPWARYVPSVVIVVIIVLVIAAAPNLKVYLDIGVFQRRLKLPLYSKISPPPKRDNPTKDCVCHPYKEVGHWRRNFLSYLAELKKRKTASGASTLGIFTLELYAFPNKTWVYDTGYGTHICITSQGLKESKKLKHKALRQLSLCTTVIRSFDLVFPSGLIILLDNYHYAPTITRSVVSIYHLVNNGYIHTFTNYGIFVSKDNVFYLNEIPRDGIYEIDMHNLYRNVSSMFKKRMDKLQRDGILQPTHDESLKKCMSCISRNMACKPFSHQVERDKDLLGLIHTNVCGPFRTVSREGASHFITFIDDFSRYAHILNMVPTKKVERTPYEIWHGKDPKLSYLRLPKGNDGLLLLLYPLENKIYLARNAEFFENNFMAQEASGSHGLLESSGSDGGLELIQEKDIQPSENTSKIHNEVVPTEGALLDPEFDKLLEAMNTEMQSMKDNGVWILVNLPPNGRIVGSKWLFKKKTNMDGKQASRSWNKRFDVEIKKIGFTQNLDEPCVYLKASGSNVAFLILYVDDILLMGNNVTMLQEVKSWLCKCFSMKDLGESAYILGIKIIRDRSKWLIALSQSSYLEKTLEKFRMENSKKGYTPMIEKLNYRKSQGSQTPSEVQRMRRVPYASAIGEIHWNTAKTILKYLRNTKDMVLVYGDKPEAELKVSCYADASFQTDKDDTKSQIGYVFVFNGRAMDWNSAKQSTTTMSSTEA